MAVHSDGVKASRVFGKQWGKQLPVRVRHVVALVALRVRMDGACWSGCLGSGPQGVRGAAGVIW